jgi:hypothetical protein
MMRTSNKRLSFTGRFVPYRISTVNEKKLSSATLLNTIES